MVFKSTLKELWGGEVWALVPPGLDAQCSTFRSGLSPKGQGKCWDSTSYKFALQPSTEKKNLHTNTAQMCSNK
eukprot:138163-Amphidinium_carterae.1